MHEHVLVAANRLRYIYLATIDIDEPVHHWLSLFAFSTVATVYLTPGRPAKRLGHLLELLQGTRT
jgi:hypothetical protein